MTDLSPAWQSALVAAAALGAAVLAALVAQRLVFAALARVARAPGRVLETSLVEHGRRPARWIAPLIALLVALPAVPLAPAVRALAQHLVGLGLIAAVAWLVIIVTVVAGDLIAARYRVDVPDNLAARRIQTQFQVLRRVVTAVVLFVAAALMLLTFPTVRALGTSLLAAGGLAGLVVGVSMRSTLANWIAGVQIALTQPIRVDDAVVVEGEWGRIEEITATYVVVRLWDWRRLVLPIAYFIDHPFENWTRTTADLIGAVSVHADYAAPVDELRAELERVVRASGKWGGRVCVLQVTDATERTVELRALADARDSDAAWDLRCEIRERLVRYLRERHPASLPTVRAEVRGAGSAPAVAPEPARA